MVDRIFISILNPVFACIHTLSVLSAVNLFGCRWCPCQIAFFSLPSSAVFTLVPRTAHYLRSTTPSQHYIIHQTKELTASRYYLKFFPCLCHKRDFHKGLNPDPYCVYMDFSIREPYPGFDHNWGMALTCTQTNLNIYIPVYMMSIMIMMFYLHRHLRGLFFFYNTNCSNCSLLQA